MGDCNQITDAAFEHLRGIHTLDMSGCGSYISDDAFVHLRGIYSLDIRGCGSRITSAAIAHLPGIHTLKTDGKIRRGDGNRINIIHRIRYNPPA